MTRAVVMEMDEQRYSNEEGMERRPPLVAELVSSKNRVIDKVLMQKLYSGKYMHAFYSISTHPNPHWHRQRDDS